MYIRWMQCRSPSWRKAGRIKVILVKCVRIDGKPRERQIASLGSICADRSDIARFWYDVTTHLDRLGISPEQREQIGAAIAAKVGGRMLTATEVRRFEQRREQLGLSGRSAREETPTADEAGRSGD